MAITKPAKPRLVDAAAADAFIGKAPDAPRADPEAKAATKHVVKGKRVQITHTIPLNVLEEVDAMAVAAGLTRAAIINLAINSVLKGGVSLDSHRE